jgi:phosphatidylserine decarboxylase
VGNGQLGVGDCAAAAGGIFSLVFSRSSASSTCRRRVDRVAGGRVGHRTATIATAEGSRQRISIFLSVFDVHVNRSPIGGVLRSVRYQKGQYLNAMNPASAERNEQNIVTVRGDEGTEITFKQIAGLLARRIVFNFKEGDRVERGQRVGLIKFGSRVDVLLPADAVLRVKVGQRVKGGASVLAAMPGGEGL